MEQDRLAGTILVHQGRGTESVLQTTVVHGFYILALGT
jgi:hypothetical protein